MAAWLRKLPNSGTCLGKTRLPVTPVLQPHPVSAGCAGPGLKRSTVLSENSGYRRQPLFPAMIDSERGSGMAPLLKHRFKISVTNRRYQTEGERQQGKGIVGYTPCTS